MASIVEPAVPAEERKLTVDDAVLAVKTDDAAELRLWLAQGGSPVAAERSVKGTTLVHWAAFLGNTACLEELLLAEGDPGVTEVDGKTPLHWAAFEGNIDAIELLASAGAPLTARDTLKHTPLDLARLQRQEAAVMLLEQLEATTATAKKQPASKPPRSMSADADADGEVEAAVADPRREVDAASTADREPVTASAAPVLFVPRNLSPVDGAGTSFHRTHSRQSARSRSTRTNASAALEPHAGPSTMSRDPWPRTIDDSTGSAVGGAAPPSHRSASAVSRMSSAALSNHARSVAGVTDPEQSINGAVDDDELPSEREAREHERRAFLDRVRAESDAALAGAQESAPPGSAAPAPRPMHDRRDPGAREESPGQAGAMAVLDAARRHVEQHDRHAHGTEFAAMDADLEHERWQDDEHELRLLAREERRIAKLERKVARKEARRQRRAAWLEQVMRLAAASHDIPREDYLDLMEHVAAAYGPAANAGPPTGASSRATATSGYSRQASSTGMPHEAYGEEGVEQAYYDEDGDGEDGGDYFEGQPMVRSALPPPQQPSPDRQAFGRSAAEQPRDPAALPAPQSAPDLGIAHWREQLAQLASKRDDGRGVNSRPATARGAAPPSARSASSRSQYQSEPGTARSHVSRCREPSTRHEPDLPLRIPLDQVRDRRAPSMGAGRQRSRSARSGHYDDGGGGEDGVEPWKPPASTRIEAVQSRAFQLSLRRRGMEPPGVSAKVNQIVPERR